MITDALLIFIYYTIYAFLLPLRLLPDATLPTEITTAITEANTYLTAIDGLIPVDTLLAVVGAFLAIEAGIFVYKTIMWVIKKIPAVN